MDLKNIPLVSFIERVNGGPAKTAVPIDPIEPIIPVVPDPIIVPVVEVSGSESVAEEYEDNMLLFNNDLFDD